MKRFICLAMTVLAIMILLPIGSVFAQKSLPQVPVIYPGDTDEAIIRRAHWIEEARKEGAVVWWGSDKPEDINRMITEFKKAYPFIKVNYWRGGGNERSNRLETEHSIGHLTVDICDAGEISNYPRWRKIGLVDIYTEIIPGIAKKDKRSYSKYGDWAQLGSNAVVPIYNTNLVPAAEAPKKWEDLLAPKWKGQIGMIANMRTWYTLALGEGGWGIEKTEDFLRRLKQQELIWTPGLTAGHNLLLAGEYKIHAGNILRLVFISQDKRAPVDWSRVSPVPITGGTFILARKAPHPKAARLFIEWLYSPQGLALYEKLTGFGDASPGSGTRLAKALEGSSLIYRTEEVVIKTAELQLVDRFAQILGVTPE